MSPEDLKRSQRAARVVASLSERIEAERRLPPAAVDALVESGVFKLLVPALYGGAQASLPTAIEFFEEISSGDGSAGWCAMVGATSGMMAAYLEESVAREIFGPADAIVCGVFAPLGQAVPEGSGFRVNGRWPFASGCEHARWRMGGAVVLRDGGPELLPNGTPSVRSVLFRADETQVVDTWTVSGLRGTGSHDIEASDVLVPASRTLALLTDTPKHSGPLYRLPVFGVLAAGVAATALGIARAAIASLIDLARGKQPLGARRTLAHRELVQLQVAQADAKVRAARAFLLDAARAAEATAASGAQAALSERATLRLAASHAAAEAALAVDLMYNAGGASSIYVRNPLQRHFRDIHVATQHAMVAPAVGTLVGRLMLGIESDTTTL